MNSQYANSINNLIAQGQSASSYVVDGNSTEIENFTLFIRAYNASDSAASDVQTIFTKEIEIFILNDTDSINSQSSLATLGNQISTSNNLSEQTQYSSIQLTHTIYNFESITMTINISLIYYNQYSQITYSMNSKNNIYEVATSTANSIMDLLEDCFFIQISEEDENIVQMKKNFVAIIQQSTADNYMLPFNLQSVKKIKVFANEQNIKDPQELTITQYTNEPFLPTIWNQLGNDIIIIPWLPYFSQCTISKRRILLRDLLLPSHCTTTPWLSLQSSFNPVQCSNKYTLFECVIEEYYVDNPQGEEWFHNYDESIFYFHSDSLNINELPDLMDDSDIINDVSKQMYQEMPLSFSSNLGINQKPKEFVLNFMVGIDADLNPSLVSSSLSVNSKYTLNVPESANYNLTENQARLHVNVKYLSDLESFFYMHYTKFYYMILPILLCLTMYTTSSLYKLKIGIYQTKLLLCLVIAPVIKGLLISCLTALLFTLFFLYLSKLTNFSLFATTFEGDDTDESVLYTKYNGRNGLVLLIVGCFILRQTIKQTFKVPTPEEMKIIIEDDEEQNQRQTGVLKSVSQKDVSFRKKQITQQDIRFSVKTLQSKRTKMFLYFFFALLGILYNYKLSAHQNTWILQALKLSIFPIAINISYKLNCYLLLEDLLFNIAFTTVGKAYFYGTVILKYHNIEGYLIVNTVIGLIFTAGFTYIQIKFHRFCVRMYEEKHPNIVEVFILKYFREFFKSQSKLSQYEVGLYFCSVFLCQICATIFVPFIYLIFSLTFQESNIFSDVGVNQTNFQIVVLISVMMIPASLYSIVLMIEIFDKTYELRLMEIIEMNQYQFRNRKLKWMSDYFRLNPTIQNYFREFEKFHFSSQLYIIIFSIAIGSLNILVGLKILFQNQYVCFDDPAFLFIFFIIWIVGDIMTVIVSYLALKFKFYEKKEESRMRTKLESLEKFLKKNQYEKYLILDQIKEHFLYTYKNWIVQNVQKILTKEMFEENNNDLLKKFKFYKNLLKRKSISGKRNSVLQSSNLGIRQGMGNKLLSVASDRSLMRDGDDEDRKNDMSLRSVYKLMQLVLKKKGPNSRFEQQKQARVIKLNKHHFNNYAKPILYYWFYTAKQNTLIKRLVQRVKESALEPHSLCEFCNMDLDIQLIEKHEIDQLINEYRIINVGLPFVPENFIQFYKSKQQFIIVCYQCKEKKFYLRKKKIKNIKIAKIIMMNWFIKCKSRLLHKSTVNFNKEGDNSKKGGIGLKGYSNKHRQSKLLDEDDIELIKKKKQQYFDRY